MRSRAHVLLVVAALSGAAASVHAAGESLPSLPPIPIETFELDNGLDVILSRDPALPIVTVNLWYHVGALHEPRGRTGFAHLFEHMMFQGSAHVAPGEHLAALERAGATDLNASTHFDRTNYYQTVPSNYLETVLWLESDRMGFMLDALDADKLELQRQVVLNERRQRVDNAPYGIAEERAWHALFPAPHPYHGNVIGSMEDLRAATTQNVREFFRRFYSPANATLAIVGDFDPAWTKRAIEQYFGSLPSAAPPAPSPPEPVRIDSALEVREELRPGTLPLVSMAWHSPMALTPGDAVADLLASVLTTGTSSRLYQRLVHESQLAQSVSAQQLSLAAQSAFVIQAIAQPGVEPERLRAAIEDELQQIRERGVQQDELVRARAVIQTAILSDLQTTSSLAERLQYYNHYTGDPAHLRADLARYEAVDPAAVQAFARAVLDPERRVLLLAEPAPESSP